MMGQNISKEITLLINKLFNKLANTLLYLTHASLGCVTVNVHEDEMSAWLFLSNIYVFLCHQMSLHDAHMCMIYY